MSIDSFIVFSDDFGEHPSSCQHIFKNLKTDVPCIWVNTVGMRLPKFSISDLKKIFLKLKKMLGATNSNHSNVSTLNSILVIQPPMLPFVSLPGIKFFNAYSVNRNIKKKMEELKISSPIIITTAPNACDYLDKLIQNRIIYYCVDDFAEWPGLNKELVHRMEEKLISTADVFIATSRKLFEKLTKTGKKVYLLTHGVDLNFFNTYCVPSSGNFIINKIISAENKIFVSLFIASKAKDILENIKRF